MSNLPQAWGVSTMFELNKFSANNIDPASFASEKFELYSVPAFPFGKPELPSGADVGSTKQLVLPGDVLISKINPRINRVWQVGGFQGYRQIASSEWIGFRNPALSSKYFLFYFRSSEFRERLCADVTGVGGSLTRAQPKRVATFTLPVPPLNEQKRIADKLDTVLARVDAVNDRLARVAPILKRFRQSVLAAATSGRLTEDWRLSVTVQNAADDLQRNLELRAKSEKKAPAPPDMTYWKKVIPPTWAVASVHQFAECLDRLRVPIKRDARKSELRLYPYYGANGEVGRIDEYIFDDELVLVTEDETFYGREKPIAYRSSGKCWVNNHAHVLRAPSKEANDYLCYSLMYYDVIPWLSGTTGRAKLTQQALNALPIAVPPAQEIAEIVRRVETLFAFADRLEARLQTTRIAANRLTPALLAKAFRGELVAQDPNDEPAAELLKRLAANAPASPKRHGRPAKAG